MFLWTVSVLGRDEGYTVKYNPLPKGGSAMTIRHPFGVFLLVVLFQGQAVTQGENKLPRGQYTSDPQYFFLQILDPL